MTATESLPSQRHWEDDERQIGVDDALARILSTTLPLAVAQLPLLEALGLILAEDVVASNNLPPFSNSAMDGYAVRASDTLGASRAQPVTLHVIGNAPAGAIPSDRVTEGTAVRIMTGAPIPDGADAVVRFEEAEEVTRESGTAGRLDRVAIARPIGPGDNVRPAGEDVRAGEKLLRAGSRLRPPEIGLLAALNRATVAVHRRPRVAILSTGDEVVDVGAALQPGQIRDSNSYLLAAMTRRYGGEPALFGIARDSIQDLRARLGCARNVDFIVTSGGVSLGDYDVVKDVLQATGEIAIWQVKMRPGKPLAFGHIGGAPILGLPGNPVAAAVSFVQFGRPVILKLLGRRDLTMPTVEATVLDRIENRGGRRHFVRVVVEGSAHEGYSARIAGHQGAGVLMSLVRANGLLVIPEHLAAAEPGMCLPVQLIDRDSEGNDA